MTDTTLEQFEAEMAEQERRNPVTRVERCDGANWAEFIQCDGALAFADTLERIQFEIDRCVHRAFRSAADVYATRQAR